jgi:hypothetical protein
VIAEFVLAVACCWLLLDAGEYLSHRFLMHRSLPGLSYFHRQHSVTHHGKPHDRTGETPEEGEDLDIGAKFYAALGAISLPLAIFHPIAYCVWLATLAGHCYGWNVLHQEMHVPRGRWFANTRLFHWIHWRHFLHHRHPTRNFGGLGRMSDLLFRTPASPTNRDRELFEQISGSR